MEVNKLPKEIQKVIRETQKRIPNRTCVGTFGFKWIDSIEGHDFWAMICDGNFTEFYRKYPKKEKTHFSYLKLLKQ
jgi:hypothetical protein